MTVGRPMPTQDDVLGYFDTLSNWGRWGDDDDNSTTRLASREVYSVRVASCGSPDGCRTRWPT